MALQLAKKEYSLANPLLFIAGGIAVACGGIVCYLLFPDGESGWGKFVAILLNVFIIWPIALALFLPSSIILIKRIIQQNGAAK